MCEAIGQKVRACREHRRLSRSELSKKSGVSTATISRLELDGTASIAVLIKLAIALGVTDSLDAIFEVPEYQTMEELLKAHEQ